MVAVKKTSRRRKRAYVSPLRQQQAKDTVARIVAAAVHLFTEKGYGATSIAEVAREAQVAERTVYASFGSKRTLLFAGIDAAIGGDTTAAAVREREWFRSVIDEQDPVRKLDLFAAGVRGIHERTASIFRVVQQAAANDPSVAETLAQHREGQSEDEMRVVDSLARLGVLRSDLNRRSALETIWALTTPNFYAQVAERGWSPQRYERWLADALRQLLLRTAS